MSEGASDSAVNLSDYHSDGNLADIFFALSVNFLLYVLLIIVFYMIVRFYLEEEVTTNVAAYNKAGYSLVPQQDKEELEEQQHQQQPHEGDGSIPSSDLIQEQSPNNVSGIEMTSKGPAKSADSPTKLTSKSSSSSGVLSTTDRIKSFINLNEWGEPEGTKQEVIQRLAICSIGLVLSFTLWGLVQERILTQTYGTTTENKEFFVYSYGLVFMNRLGGLLFSAMLMYYFAVPWYPSALWEYSFPSVANMLSSWCQYEALKYVSFPLAMLAKAFKMVPIMLMGKFMNNKRYESYEYISGGMVGFGLYLFLDSSEPLTLEYNVFGSPETIKGAMCGVILLVLFLFFDSFTGQWQTRMFSLNPQLSPLQMMAIMNAFSATFSFITLIHQEELVPSLEFVSRHPEMIIHLLLFALCSTIGQLFIFYTVKHFGAVVFSIIMSLRILFSTLLSCYIYSHPIQEMGYLGILIVCLATGYRLVKKTEGKPLIRWKDQTVETSGSIFKEWHEHLDI